jgi:hypothetical protein
LKCKPPKIIAPNVSLGWDPSARPETDELRRGQKIFQQKNICDLALSALVRKIIFGDLDKHKKLSDWIPASAGMTTLD